MRYAITGATGLLGANLANTLLQDGHSVVATRRASSRVDHLSDLALEWREAPLDDKEALARAFEGCDGVFHCAAAVTVKMKVEPWITQANVDGTRHVLEVLRALPGKPRLVHCSSTVAVGLSTDGEPVDESTPWNLPEAGLDDAYAVTKRQAEELVMQAAQSQDAVIVNPGYMIGPYDARPSSGKLVLDLIKGKVPGYTPGRNSFVDVRDVARGMALAMASGRSGQRYILGGHNLHYRDFMALVSEVTGAKPVKRAIPAWAARLVGLGGDLYERASGREPLLNSATIRWSQEPRFVASSEKAMDELGYRISPLETAIADAVAWFREHKML